MSEIFRTPFPQMRGSHIAISEGRTPVGITFGNEIAQHPDRFAFIPQVTQSYLDPGSSVGSGNAGHLHPLSCAYPAE